MWKYFDSQNGLICFDKDFHWSVFFCKTIWFSGVWWNSRHLMSLLEIFLVLKYLNIYILLDKWVHYIIMQKLCWLFWKCAELLANCATAESPIIILHQKSNKVLSSIGAVAAEWRVAASGCDELAHCYHTDTTSKHSHHRRI